MYFIWHAFVFKMFYQVGVICQFCCGGCHRLRPWAHFRGFLHFHLPVSLVISWPRPHHNTYCAIVGAHVGVAWSCLLRFIMLFCLSCSFGFCADHSSRCSIMFRDSSNFHCETVLCRRNARTMRTFPIPISFHIWCSPHAALVSPVSLWISLAISTPLYCTWRFLPLPSIGVVVLWLSSLSAPYCVFQRSSLSPSKTYYPFTFD